MSGAWNEHSMEVTLPAIPDRLEPLFVRFRQWCRSIASPADSFAAELLLREALTNAVVHGCKCDPALAVSCRVRINSRRILIGVSDGGAGFDWRAPRDRGQSADCGRGIDILHLYGSRVRFNNKGNAAFILKRLDEESSQMTNGDTEHV